MEDQYPDRIFVKDNLTTAEKLLFANSYIKDLKKRIQELEIELGKTKSHNEELKSITKEEKIEAKKDENLKQLQQKNTAQKKLIQELRESNEKLIIEVLKYRK